MLAVDTNVIVRYLTNDHPQSPRARDLVNAQAVFVPVTVILELEWVLRSAYGYLSSDVVRAIRLFAGLPTVTVEEEAIVAAALDLAEQGMDFADALHLSKAARCEAMASFDQRFVKAAKRAGFDNVHEP